MLTRVRTAAVGVISCFSESGFIKEGKKSSEEASENQNCKTGDNSLLWIMSDSSAKTVICIFWIFIDNMLVVIKCMSTRIFMEKDPTNLLALFCFTIIVLQSRSQHMKESQNFQDFILTPDL